MVRLLTQLEWKLDLLMRIVVKIEVFCGTKTRDQLLEAGTLHDISHDRDLAFGRSRTKGSYMSAS